MTNWRFLLALLLSVTCPTAWAQLPVGGEFQVNSYTTSYQNWPSVASDVNGSFVVVWASNGQDGSSSGVFGQRFDASGLPQGAEFPVNSYTTGYQGFPAVASDANGNFVVVWDDWGQEGSGSDVVGQRFNAAGVPQGGEFRVNSYTTGLQGFPAVASDANGNFVVVWDDWGQEGSGSDVVGQRFNAAGVPQGGEFRVNSYTTGLQGFPAVASDANGNFVVVWDSYQDAGGSGVFGQRFDASGLPQGGEFQVNSYTTGKQNWAAVASDANGSFIVAWQSDGQDGSGRGVFGQRFNASGLPQGGEFPVNSYTTGYQTTPAVASDANGNFVVLWASVDAYWAGVSGQRFNAAGVPQGGEFPVNSYTTSYQNTPAVASAGNGNFVAVWMSKGQDGSDWGVFGQRYGDLIFRDGFQ